MLESALCYLFFNTNMFNEQVSEKLLRCLICLTSHVTFISFHEMFIFPVLLECCLFSLTESFILAVFLHRWGMTGVCSIWYIGGAFCIDGA